MSANKKGPSRLRVGLIAAFPLAFCAAAAAAYVGLTPPPVPSSAASAGIRATYDLEDAFWRCDYVATRHGVHATPTAFCSEVTTELQKQNFGGDFMQLLEWWRQNKRAEHARLESLQLAGTSGR